MEESDVLQHLLHVENEASALAEEAQTEADKRVAERERQAREAYTARYGERVAELDADYQKESISLAEEYQRDLAAYRTDLESKSIDEKRFASLVTELLFEGR